MIRQDSNTPEPENLVLQPRNVTFDWVKLPTHWVPDEPLVTHTINVLHLKVLGDRDLPAKRRQEWLIERLSIIAAIEHITAMLGNWALNANALDAADATMLDLLRWHGAEKVEHRAGGLRPVHPPRRPVPAAGSRHAGGAT